MNKQLLVRSIVVGFTSAIVLFGTLMPQIINADSENLNSTLNSAKVVKTVKMMVTAYSSTINQTDSTPRITASNKEVFDGLVANNKFPFGTKIRIPALFGDKIFIIEDRMHQRKGDYHVDIWFSKYRQAKEFGARLANVEILES